MVIGLYLLNIYIQNIQIVHTWLFHAFLYPSLPDQIHNRLCMFTAQWPALARGTASSNTSRLGVSHVWVSKFNVAKLFVHFHSFSCVATLTSSITRGTQPPKMSILCPIKVALCKDLGSGVGPLSCGLFQVMLSEYFKKKNENLLKHISTNRLNHYSWMQKSSS